MGRTPPYSGGHLLWVPMVSAIERFYCISCYDKDLLHNSIKEKVLDLTFLESFLREICPKNRHSRKFLSNSSRFCRHAKVSAGESFCP